MDGILRHVSRAMAMGSAVLIFAMMWTMSIDVGHRIVTGSSIAGVYELVESLVVGSIFLGLAYAERRQEHVSVELVTRRLSPRIAAWTRVAGTSVSVVIVGWMAYATSVRALHSAEAGEFRQGLMEFPLWPARVAVAVGLIALFAELLATWGRSFRLAGRGGEFAPAPRDT